MDHQKEMRLLIPITQAIQTNNITHMSTCVHTCGLYVDKMHIFQAQFYIIKSFFDIKIAVIDGIKRIMY